MIYTFDPEHRLTSVGTSAYAYDGAGTRLRAIHSGIETRYVYDLAGNLLAEADANNQVMSYYLHGLGLLAMITPQDETFSYHYDGTGNTIVITDQARNIQNTYAYTPFGITTENEVFDQPFTFSGQYGVTQEPTGLYYMRARYYDPILGRFISEDPISFAGGDVNLFAYVGNNPISFVDPWGVWSIVYNAGVEIPYSPGVAIGISAGSELQNPISPDGALVGKGISIDAVFGEIGGGGVSAGIGDISDSGGRSAGDTISINHPLMGKYGGVQITLRKDISWKDPSTWIPDAVQVGLGVGAALPVTYSTAVDLNGSNRDRQGSNGRNK